MRCRALANPACWLRVGRCSSWAVCVPQQASAAARSERSRALAASAAARPCLLLAAECAGRRCWALATQAAAHCLGEHARLPAQLVPLRWMSATRRVTPDLLKNRRKKGEEIKPNPKLKS